VLKPAVAEINALAAFQISVLPVKTGRKVSHIKVGWWAKDGSALREAFDEVQRSRVGRRARIAGVVEQVANPSPSSRRLPTRSSRPEPQPVTPAAAKNLSTNPGTIQPADPGNLTFSPQGSHTLPRRPHSEAESLPEILTASPGNLTF